MQLLRNQVYLGNMVQGKREVISFKTEKRRVVDPNDWIVVQGTHEPIISKELWDRVHERLNRRERVKVSKGNTVGLFSGRIFCESCKSPLAYMRKALRGGEKGVYRCSRYNNCGVNACSSHYIDESYLSEFVLNDVKLYAKLATAARERLCRRLFQEMNIQRNSESKSLLRQKSQIDTRLTEIASRLQNLYNDKCEGKLSEQVAFGLMDGFAKEQQELEEKRNLLSRQIEAVQCMEHEVGSWMGLIEQQLDICELDRATVMELIDRVVVSEGVDTNGKRTLEVSIHYRFIGNLLDKSKEGIA